MTKSRNYTIFDKKLRIRDYAFVIFILLVPSLIGYLLGDLTGLIIGLLTIPLAYIVCVLKNIKKGVRVSVIFKKGFYDLLKFCGHFFIY